MTMTNFEYLLLFFLVALTVFLAVVIAKYIKYKHLLKLTKINVLRRQQKKEINFYAEVVLVKAFRKIYFSFSKEAKKALREIVFGRTESAQIFLNKKDKIKIFISGENLPGFLFFKQNRKNRAMERISINKFSMMNKIYPFDSTHMDLNRVVCNGDSFAWIYLIHSSLFSHELFSFVQQ